MNPIEWVLFLAARTLQEEFGPEVDLSSVEEAARQIVMTGFILEGYRHWADRLHPSLWIRILETPT